MVCRDSWCGTCHFRHCTFTVFPVALHPIGQGDNIIGKSSPCSCDKILGTGDLGNFFRLKQFTGLGVIAIGRYTGCLVQMVFFGHLRRLKYCCR